MVKVYVRFGEFKKNETINVFEGLLEDKVVKIIMPTVLYATCQTLARYVDLPAFIVDGHIIGKDKDGMLLMENILIKIPLVFDKNMENYISEITIPKPRKRQKNIKIPRWRDQK